MTTIDELTKRHDLRTISSGEIRWLMAEVARLTEFNLQLAEQVTCEYEHTRVSRMQLEEMAVRLKAVEAVIAFLEDLNDQLYKSQTAANQECEIAEGKLAAAEAEVSAMAVTMAETNLAMVDLQRRLATAEGLLTTITGNWESGERFTKAINLDWNGVVVQPERIDVTVSREWYERAKEVCGD
jgi:hypothetical protein